MATRAAQLLEQLDSLKLTFSASSGERIERLLKRLERESVTDAESLITLHESLLFLRAYPQSATIVDKTESLLRAFSQRCPKKPLPGSKI
jgi:hypothetical protein